MRMERQPFMASETVVLLYWCALRGGVTALLFYFLLIVVFTVISTDLISAFCFIYRIACVFIAHIYIYK